MFDYTTNILYFYASKRLAKRRKFLGLSNKEIADREEKTEPYYDPVFEKWLPPEKIPKKSKFDPILVSRIINNKCTSQNRYLIPPSYIELLVSKMHFSNQAELFWGSDWEIDYVAYEVFKCMMLDLMNQDYKEKIDNLLIDYVPYARFNALLDILHKTLEERNISRIKLKKLRLDSYEMESYDFLQSHMEDIQEISSVLATYTQSGILMEDFTNKSISEPKVYIDLIENFEKIRDESIMRQYISVKDSFIEVLKEFFNTHKTFKHLPKHISFFSTTEFIPLLNASYLEQHQGKDPSIESVGKRVYDIFRLDIEPLLMQEYINRLDNHDLRIDNLLTKKQIIYPELINASVSYINHLNIYQNKVDKIKNLNFRLNQEWEIKYDEFLCETIPKST